MCEINIRLSNIRPVNKCLSYIFPAEYYDIPGVENYDDLDKVLFYANEKIKIYANKKINLYLNGGMAIEVLTAIKSAQLNNIDLTLYHYDRNINSYLPQKLKNRKILDIHRYVIDKGFIESFKLCEGRHEDMEGTAIYSYVNDERIHDFKWMYDIAKENLADKKGSTIRLYLSGLTSLFVSVLNVACDYDIALILMHYNTDTEEYFEQYM